MVRILEGSKFPCWNEVNLLSFKAYNQKTDSSYLTFYDHFNAASNLFEQTYTWPPLPIIDHFSQDTSRPQFTLRPSSSDIVLNALLTLESKCSTGDDKLDFYLLKLVAPFLARCLSYIFNVSILSCTVPLAWKTANVSPLHKGSEISVMNNYRPYL